MSTFVILLRAIGPVTHKRMGMTQWREAARSAGFAEPRTVLNTGNMIAGHDGSAARATADMRMVLKAFGLSDNVVPILRRPSLLRALLTANPFREAALDHPSAIGVYFFATKTPEFGWLDDYDGPEQTHVTRHHLIVDFSRGVAKAGKLIRMIDKNCGTNTSRSWSSVAKIAAALP